jgi:general stress protein 26
MGMLTATIEMRSPEELRERLHDLVKATRMVLVMSCAPGPRALGRTSGTAGTAEIDGMPMTLVRVADDSTLYAALALDAKHEDALERDSRVMVVVPGAEYALFTAEALVSRDRALIESLWDESWRRWFRGKSDPAIAIVVLSPIEGSFWEDGERQQYIYRLVGRLAPVRGTREAAPPAQG